ncbi:tetratricopeptide repeat protein [Nocardia sp. GP40]|uniref:serine/threonine-protein kinase n=1 Tax=Nocardia sp. GP40 TaxID=3156268 RepID=UPI003D1B445F
MRAAGIAADSTKCAELGCGGTIVGGYCDVCGTAPESAAPHAPPEPAAAGRATAPAHGAAAAGERCGEHGCGGTISNGVCDTCGIAASTSRPGGGVSTPATGGVAGAGRTGTRTVHTRSTTSRSRRGRLGAGMVEVPRVPRVDPSTAVLADPRVPEGKRFCSNCERPVGRSRDGTPGRAEGFCSHCGTRYSFTPKLRRGELIGQQYEVLGPIAHGGLGWLYLAVDRNVSDRWVVLKGLLNSQDPDAMAAALAERRFLAQVEHPNIVKIFNFVEHAGPEGIPVGYIVMEYVGGASLKQLLRRRREATGAFLPPEQAIAYILEMLPALGYLHALGLAYCDFKPDNVMQSDEQLKLIDLGAVIAMDDRDSPLYGTTGYQAPEIAETGPTIASEVYTVGRTLAVLMLAVPQRDGHFAELPGPSSEPLLEAHESLHRFLVRATDAAPEARFASIEEMADQLTGVLRMVLSATSGVPHPGSSVNFGPPRGVFGVDAGADENSNLTAAQADSPARSAAESSGSGDAGRGAAVLGGEAPAGLDARDVVAALPVPLVDPSDSGAALLATTSGVTPAELGPALEAGLRAVVTGEGESVEIPLRLVRAALETGDAVDAQRRIDELAAGIGVDWRLTWYRGLARLLVGEFDAAAAEFDAVHGALPGETAPQLALAAAAELCAAADIDPDIESARAARYYESIWRTDHGFVSAAFGLARLRRAAGDREAAVAVLDQVDPSSARHTDAAIAAAQTLLAGRDPADITEELLREGGSRVERLVIESKYRAAQVRRGVLDAALDWLSAGNAATEPAPLLGHALTHAGVRTGLEGCYRDLAHDAGDMWGRIALVDRANQVRPRTTL